MSETREEIIAKVNALMERVPEGYEIMTVGRFPKTMHDKVSGRHYVVSIQLANQQTFDISRGVGMTLEEAFEHSLANIGGDDGLSASIRDSLQGTKH